MNDENMKNFDDEMNDDFDENNSIETPQQFEKWQKKVEAENAAENREELSRFKKAVDDDGNFKSLKHKMEYHEEELPHWLPGSPDPKDYSAENEERFWADYNSYHQTGRLVGNLDPLPDDEHRAVREDLTRQIMKHRQAAAIAEANGKTEAVRIHNNLARCAENDLRKVPKSARDVRAEEDLFKNDEITADTLFDPDYQNDPSWENERVQRDSAVFLSEHNKRAKRYIRLPLESGGRGGNILPCKPSNMIKFDLQPDVMERFQKHVYEYGGPMDPAAVFRRSWNFLNISGYAHTGELAVKPKGKGKKAEPKKSKAEDDRWRDQKSYEKWREKTAGPNGLRRF